MQGKINKSAVENLQPGELLADVEVKGFVARCLPSGTVSYGYRYRNAKGEQKWLPLGTGQVTAEQARKAAKMGQGKGRSTSTGPIRRSPPALTKSMDRARRRCACWPRCAPRSTN